MQHNVCIDTGQYDRHEVEQERVRKGLSLPDSDGWVTVVSKRPHSVGHSRV